MDGKEYEKASFEFGQTIASSDNPGQVCAAYFYRGDSRAQMGQNQESYADFYTAKAMCCYLSQNEKTAGMAMGATLVMSDCCLKFAPEHLKNLESKMDQEEINSAVKLARSRLDEKYLEK